jgi:hypothetical protein
MHNNIKKLNIAFNVKECDANEVDLYSAAGPIKTKITLSVGNEIRKINKQRCFIRKEVG